jgi:type VI protein secretion system component Hcp
MSDEKNIPTKNDDLTNTKNADPQLNQEALNNVSGGGEVVHDPFVITKLQDAASPKLY